MPNSLIRIIYGFASLPRGCQTAALVPPVRGPGKGHELHGNIGFGGLDGDGFELFVQRIGRRSQCLAFDFELRFEIGQLLLKRRDIFFGRADILRFFHHPAGTPDCRRGASDVRGADRLPSEEGPENGGSDGNGRLHLAGTGFSLLFLLCGSARLMRSCSVAIFERIFLAKCFSAPCRAAPARSVATALGNPARTPLAWTRLSCSGF